MELLYQVSALKSNKAQFCSEALLIWKELAEMKRERDELAAQLAGSKVEIGELRQEVTEMKTEIADWKDAREKQQTRTTHCRRRLAYG
jgi:uncharacterized coiled-coil DUF342 family protein